MTTQEQIEAGKDCQREWYASLKSRGALAVGESVTTTNASLSVINSGQFIGFDLDVNEETQDSVYASSGARADRVSREIDVIAFLSIESRTFSDISERFFFRKDSSNCTRLLSRLVADGSIVKAAGRYGRYSLSPEAPQMI